VEDILGSDLIFKFFRFSKITGCVKGPGDLSIMKTSRLSKVSLEHLKTSLRVNLVMPRQMHSS
jgi:hypothetical protein